MADSVREKILKNVETTLETITTDNGYNNTVSAVQRWNHAGNDVQSVTDGPVILILPGQEQKEMQPPTRATCRLMVDLAIFIYHDVIEDADKSTDELMSSILADVEKALMLDASRGGNAMDTNLQGSQPFEIEGGQPYAGIIVDLQLVFRHQLSDPTQP